MKHNPPDRQFLTTAETAALLRVSDRTVRDWIRRGLIESIKVGGRRLIPAAALRKIGRVA